MVVTPTFNPARRVLFLSNDAPFFLGFSLPVAAAAARAGYDVHIATPPSPAVARIIEAGLTWHQVRIARSSLNPVRELLTLADIARLYRRIAPDLVYQVTPKPLLYGTIVARLLRVPRVVNVVAGLGYVHGETAPRLLRFAGQQAYRFGLRHPKMWMVFENEENRATLHAKGGFALERTTIIRGAGVDVKRFVPVPRPAQSPVVVVYAGRLLFDKGVGEFIEAARRLAARSAGVRMVVVGEPDPSNPVSVQPSDIQAWAAEGIVEFLGQRSDMPTVLGGASIVCLPSYYPEGVPRILIEAAACGLPAITTNTPGCRDIVVDGVTGLLVPTRDVDAIVAAIERLAGDPALRAAFGAAARARAVEQFSREAAIATTLGIFERLFR